MRAPDWLFVGLGNPGEKYARTRHNIGWMVAERLAEKYKASFVPGRGDWLEASFTIGSKHVVAMLPTTYMNASGEAVSSFCKKHFLLPERVVAIVDEYNFPVGTIHLKGQGSDGGHNGLTSLIEELGTDKFWRLRCGIDRKFGQGELVKYVLSPFEHHEAENLELMVQQAVETLEFISRLGAQKAMNHINTLKKTKPKTGENTETIDKK